MSTALLTEVRYDPKYAGVRRLLHRMWIAVLPWESLVGSLWMGALVGVLIGIQLLTPPSTFASSTSFAVLERLIPEPWLGGLFVVVSSLGLAALHQRWAWGQLQTSAALAGLYAYLAMGFLPASPSGLGWVTYAGLGMCLALSVGARLVAESRGGE